MSQLRINLNQGSVVLNFTPEAARELKQKIGELMQSLKAIASQTSTKPSPQKPMEYRYSGEVFLEVFCNPNIYGSPFAAKVLITIRDEKIRLTTEGELTRLLEDLDYYLEQ
jgi:hypothetical protein